ncbi:hypothetical protein JOC55_001091 [Paenibacillus sacheonensis]|nr:hypothetical protein [Paenibacillus sacheonensis]
MILLQREGSHVERMRDFEDPGAVSLSVGLRVLLLQPLDRDRYARRFSSDGRYGLYWNRQDPFRALTGHCASPHRAVYPLI